MKKKLVQVEIRESKPKKIALVASMDQKYTTIRFITSNASLRDVEISKGLCVVDTLWWRHVHARVKVTPDAASASRLGVDTISIP